MAGRCVYVVDDDDAIRRALDFMLRFKGYTVSLFESGPAFLNVAAALVPGCILLDIRMPHVDGLEVQRRLIDQELDLPVVVMTGHGDLGVAIEAMTSGAIGFVEKPFHQATLMDALRVGFLKVEDPDGYDAYRAGAAAAVDRLDGEGRRLLRALAEGRSNDELADLFGMATAAVEVRRARLLSTLGVDSPHDAVRLAFAAGETPGAGPC